MFVLLDDLDETGRIIRQLRGVLDALMTPYAAHPAIVHNGAPYLIHAVGRTWQEALLITKGYLRQGDIPLAGHGDG